MAYQQVLVELIRDGECTPWGFRLTGGADIGAPLVIQKASLGSPSEGELQKGDILLRVRDSDATRLSHQTASDLIVRAGSTLKLVVARRTGTAQTTAAAGGASSPPLRPLLTPTPMDSNQGLFKPLPTTNFPTQRQRRMSAESYTSTTSSDTEKEAIVNQPYRSIPLITPSAKTTKDTAVGSYLRFDPLHRTPQSIGSRSSDPFMLNKVQEAILEAAHTSGSMPRTPTPEMGNYNGPQIYLRQYNSPIHMYSNQAIVEALVSQTSAIKPQASQNFTTKPLISIKSSPTYQLIHDEEWKNLDKGSLREHEPLEEKVHNVIPSDGCRTEIQQSGSFKTIMNTLHGITEF